MQYCDIVSATFLERLNRFIAKVLHNGEEKMVHVKNTGRCRELLIPGATVYLEDFTTRMGERKLAYSLIAVEKSCPDGSRLLVNMDSQAPNQVVKEALQEGKLSLPGFGRWTVIRPEVRCGEARLDFYVQDEGGKEAYIEVKGVTLESERLASFPDAPTLRGIKHLYRLAELAQKGSSAYVLFVVQMEGMKCFSPNEERHPAFAQALREVKDKGVGVLVYGCSVTKDSLCLADPIPVRL